VQEAIAGLVNRSLNDEGSCTETWIGQQEGGPSELSGPARLSIHVLGI
jgi:hypothetical protein